MTDIDTHSASPTTRRRFLGSAGALAAGLAIPSKVDQFIDPIAPFHDENSQEEADLLPLQSGPFLLKASMYRVIGPGHPLESTTPHCNICGEQAHSLNGRLIYTVGCQPAAMPAGWAKSSGFEMFDIVYGAHPVGISIPNCPGARLAPHVHSQEDYVWV